MENPEFARQVADQIIDVFFCAIRRLMQKNTELHLLSIHQC